MNRWWTLDRLLCNLHYMHLISVHVFTSNWQLPYYVENGFRYYFMIKSLRKICSRAEIKRTIPGFDTLATALCGPANTSEVKLWFYYVKYVLPKSVWRAHRLTSAHKYLPALHQEYIINECCNTSNDKNIINLDAIYTVNAKNIFFFFFFFFFFL